MILKKLAAIERETESRISGNDESGSENDRNIIQTSKLDNLTSDSSKQGPDT